MSHTWVSRGTEAMARSMRSELYGGIIIHNVCPECGDQDPGQCGMWGGGGVSVCQRPAITSGPQLARLRRRRTEAAHWWPLGCCAPARGLQAQSAKGWGQHQTHTRRLKLILSSPDSHSAMLKQ